jgi:hypothetical protein
MLRPLLLVATVAAGLTAAPAHAAPLAAHCAYAAAAVHDGAASADSYAGVAYGYAAFDDLGPHTLRCYVTVNGVEQSPATLTAAGNALVRTAGPVSYLATDTDVVALCADVDATFPTHAVTCEAVSQVPVPPTELYDAVDTFLATLWSVTDPIDYSTDTIQCPLFAALAPGVPGVVDITPEGDVTIVGVGPFWDCPPYGDLFPPDDPPRSWPGLRVHGLLP